MWTVSGAKTQRRAAIGPDGGGREALRADLVLVAAAHGHESVTVTGILAEDPPDGRRGEPTDNSKKRGANRT